MSLNYANAIDNLSLENFEDIKIQLKGFEINTSKKVNIFVDSIFQRILSGSDNNGMGAKMCNELYLMSTSSVKTMVLEKVLYLVEQHSVKDDLRVLRSNNDDATAEGRINCFTTFIVEFFKVDLLAVNHVHTYMQRLLDLNYISESSVYIASNLLLSCGTELYNTNHQLGVLKKFVEYLENFCQANKTRTEIRMNFKKIIELQQNDWQINKKTTTVNNEINDNQPCTIVPHGIQIAEVEIPEYFDAQSSTDESSDKNMKSIIKAVLSDPLSTSKYVQEVAKINDKRCYDLLMVACKEELVKCFETVSLYTGKDELLELINNIQNEEDPQKLKELKIILDCRLYAQRNAILIVKFIGKLYNFDLLNSSTLVWIEFLLDYDNINENTTECFCKFLITVGPKLICDEQGHELYQTYSKKLLGISKNQVFNMPSHVKKLIDEVVKLT